jgi:hypothetical protein
MANLANERKAPRNSRVLGNVAARLRRRFTDHKIYGNFVAEIPEPMFRQLAREGLFRAKVFYGGIAGAILLPNLGSRSHLGISDFPIYGIGLLVWAVIGYYCWPWLTQQAVERELHYRRREGKWRWDR